MATKKKTDLPLPVENTEIVEAAASAGVEPDLPPTSPHAVVGHGTQDSVFVSAMVYKNLYAKKSLSVHHLQRRLNELGYPDAYSDVDGYFGDGTRRSVAQFIANHGLQTTEQSLETYERIFEGDPNVEVFE